MRELFTTYPTQLLGGGLLVLLGILVRFFPNLIAGYNTMSAEQKKTWMSRIIAFHVLEPGGDRHRLDRIGYAGRKSGRRKWVLAVDFLWLPAGCVFLLVKAQKYDRNK